MASVRKEWAAFALRSSSRVYCGTGRRPGSIANHAGFCFAIAATDSRLQRRGERRNGSNRSGAGLSVWSEACAFGSQATKMTSSNEDLGQRTSSS